MSRLGPSLELIRRFVQLTQGKMEEDVEPKDKDGVDGRGPETKTTNNPGFIWN
jgi:hypothetical protein